LSKFNPKNAEFRRKKQRYKSLKTRYKNELIGQSIKSIHNQKECNEQFQHGCSIIIGDTTICPRRLIRRDGHEVIVDTRTTTGLWDGKDAYYGVSRIKEVI
jgi:hypothetical protein